MLSKDEIISQTNRGLGVFREYIPFDFKLGRNFKNPLYEDTKASCNVYLNRVINLYCLKDFGNDDFSGDCFAFVGHLMGLDCGVKEDFVLIMQRIVQDMGLRVGVQHPVEQQVCAPAVEVVAKPYSFREREYSASELEFWMQFGITSQVLQRYKVVAVAEYAGVSKDGKPFVLRASPQEPMFGYVGSGFVKLYRPHSSLRFLYGGTLSDKYCFGLEQLPTKGDILFITGGEKDVMALAAQGFFAICFNSETSAIPTGIIKRISYRFKHLVLLFDVDKTGLESSLKQVQLLKEFHVRHLLLPLSGSKQEKDVADYFSLGHSAKDLKRLFLELLNGAYSETLCLLKACEIDFNCPPVLAEMLISVNGVPLGSAGNLFCITGGEGTGKSNYASALLAGAIGNCSEVDTLGAEVACNTERKAVLLYDTEQSEAQLYKNMKSVVRRANLSAMPAHFKAYCLAGMSRKERLTSIVESLDRFYIEFGGIQLVVIDGVADLISSANDETESIRVVDELYRLAGIYHTCIIGVLHFIPNGLKLRGHLGSELQRKSAAIVSIERDVDPAVSLVKALKVRDGSPLDVPILQFQWNKTLNMHTYNGVKPKEDKEKRKEEELYSVARTLFKKQPYCTYAELGEHLAAQMDVSERTAKSYIKFMKEKALILKDPSNDSVYILGNV